MRGQTTETGCHDHAGRHGLTVKPFTVSLAPLDRVTEGMSIVENRTPPGFALIICHYFGLQLAGAGNCQRQRIGVPGKQRIDIVFQPAEERCVDDRTVLDDFRETG